MYKEEIKKNNINSRIQGDSPSMFIVHPLHFYLINAYFIQIMIFEIFKYSYLKIPYYH